MTNNDQYLREKQLHNLVFRRPQNAWAVLVENFDELIDKLNQNNLKPYYLKQEITSVKPEEFEENELILPEDFLNFSVLVSGDNRSLIEIYIDNELIERKRLTLTNYNIGFKLLSLTKKNKTIKIRVINKGKTFSNYDITYKGVFNNES